MTSHHEVDDVKHLGLIGSSAGPRCSYLWDFGFVCRQQKVKLILLGSVSVCLSPNGTFINISAVVFLFYELKNMS